MRRLAVATTLTLVLNGIFLASGTSPASGDPAVCVPGAIQSNNIDCIGLIPNPGVIGARFRHGVMYVTSVTGLTTYDISDPENPQELGFLPLPHFENEDVDLGRDILLISNDAAESTGILYVIGIEDPENPYIRSQVDMGGNPVFGGPGHTASCLLKCTFAWVTDGGTIRVIDLRNPDNPKTKGNFRPPVGGLAMHDVQTDRNGLAWVAGFDGTAAYRLPQDYASDPLEPKLVTQTNEKSLSTYDEEFGLGDGDNYNDFIHHNSYRRKNDNVVFITEEDYTRPTCKGAGSFQTWRLPVTAKGSPRGDRLVPLDKWQTELLTETPTPTAENPAAAMCSAHYFDVSNNLVAQGWYEQGTRFLDVSDEHRIRQIGYYIHPNSATWAAYFAPTDKGRRTVYVLDATSGIEILHIDRPAKGPLSAPHNGCGGSPSCLDNHKVAKKTAPVSPALRALWETEPGVGLDDDRFGYACRLTLSAAQFP